MTRHVVAGVDGSARTTAVAEWAAREAGLRGLPLRLVHASPPLPRTVRAMPGPAVWGRGAERMLEQLISELSQRHPDVPVSGETVAAPAVRALLAAAQAAEVLVVGARGIGGFTGLAVGSVALRAAAAAECPVVVLPEAPGGRGGEGYGDGDGDGGEVVVGVDARAPAPEAVEFAFEAARLRDARLRAVYAWALPTVFASPWMVLEVPEKDRATWEDEEVQLLSDALRGWREKYPSVPVLPDVVLLNPAKALVDASRRAELVVLGRRSPPAVPEPHLGPVSHAVLHHARCPAAVVPHRG